MREGKQSLLQFNPKLPRLSKSEKTVLKLLVEAGRLISPIYQEQENQIQKVSKKEIEKAQNDDPAISSPYTVIERINDRLVAIPYHIKYAKLLKPIADKLNEASKITDNKEFSKFLKLQAKALTEGSYEEATIVWLRMKPYILDITIGPLEHFDDQVFFAKAAYHSWVGILNTEATKKLNYYKSVVLSTRRESFIPGERLENYEKVKAKVIDVLLLAGLGARTRFVGLNLPMNLKIVEKYGSEVTIFNQVNDLRMKEQVLPTFNKIFSLEFRKGFSPEDLGKGSLSYVALHEIAHNYLFYKKSAERLQDLLPPIYELTATLLAMRIAGSLLLKEIITKKQLESMIVAFICRSYDLVEKSKINKYMSNYALGGDIFINFMLKSGAIKQKEGMTMPNFMKIFLSLQELSYIMERLLSSGTKKGALIFIRKYGG